MSWLRTSTSGLAALVLLATKLEQTVFILTVGGLALVAMLRESTVLGGQ